MRRQAEAGGGKMRNRAERLGLMTVLVQEEIAAVAREQVAPIVRFHEETFNVFQSLREQMQSLAFDAYTQGLIHGNKICIGWISVEERLPDEDGRLWAILTDKMSNGKVIGYYPLYEYYHFDNGWATDDRVTHWLDVKLPTLPAIS
jgi:uncharacterized protein DUF551